MFFGGDNGSDDLYCTQSQHKHVQKTLLDLDVHWETLAVCQLLLDSAPDFPALSVDIF